MKKKKSCFFEIHLVSAKPTFERKKLILCTLTVSTGVYTEDSKVTSLFLAIKNPLEAAEPIT